MITVDATNLPRAMACPGWLFMRPSAVASDSDTTARDEGTAAHWASNQIFNGASPESLVDRKAPNGFVISSEMIDHVSNYLATLNCGQMEVVTSFAGDGWQVNARADHIKYDPGIWYGDRGLQTEEPTKALTVDEFKYGFRIVEPEMNWTLIAHAIGYCNNLAIQPDLIILRVHQPRPFHPNGKLREWVITYPDLVNFHDQIATMLANPPQELRTGPQCGKCSARFDCPAFRSASNNAIDATSEIYSDDISGEALAIELDILQRASDVLETRLNALRELATFKIKQGGTIPNYGVNPRYGDSRFRSGITPEMLKALTGIDCTKTTTVTPAEAKRRAKGNEAALIAIESLIDRPLIGTKLARINPDEQARRLLKK